MTKKTKKKNKLNNPLKLDLACGANKAEGFVGVDICKLPGVDIVFNLEKKPWPFEDDSVEEIVSNHYVEHTPDLILFMEECHRILVPGGKMTLVAPYWTSARCWQDPTHKRPILEQCFLYFNKKWRDDNKLSHYPITTDFDFTYGYLVAPEWRNRSDEAKAFAIKHYFNVVEDIQVILTKRKKE
jgi:SAM-dependent methyltransferase